jgi:FkbH-like protein
MSFGPGRIQISEIQKQIDENIRGFSEPRISRLGIISSLNLGPIDLIMRRHASISGVDLKVKSGSFDNPIEDVKTMSVESFDYILLIPNLESSVPDASVRFKSADPTLDEGLIDSFVDRWTTAAAQLPPHVEVICCLPDLLVEQMTNGPHLKNSMGSMRLRNALADGLLRIRPTSFIDTRAIISKLGRSRALDLRMFFRGKAPYTLEFLDELSQLVWRQTREFGTRYPKALIVDCDNTLWGGVVGEDGINGIKLDPFDYPGNIFWRVQSHLKYLQRNGVLLCLATKNEQTDVEDVFQSHDSMLLRKDDFVAMRISWENKPTMIKSIADELNIGLDSIAFLDDSNFEIESVANQLPSVTIFKVPQSLSDYPIMFEDVMAHFQPVLNSSSGLSKTNEYLLRSKQLEFRSLFENQEDYLRSLDVRLKVVRQDQDRSSRLSELTMKTNQFNLTTRRMTEEEIRQAMSLSEGGVWSCHVSDRFGDHGLTGLAVFETNGVRAAIHNVLLSCRVLGRGIEDALLATLCEWLFKQNYQEIVASRIATAKNAQTEKFLADRGFIEIENIDGSSKWLLKRSSRQPTIPDWITVEFDD